MHVDGARFANAAAALGVGLPELVAAAGIDLLSFGGTKNGLMLGEAVVVFDQRARARDAAPAQADAAARLEDAVRRGAVRRAC